MLSSRPLARLALLGVLGAWTLSGCNSEGGSGEYTQEFEKPADAVPATIKGEENRPKSRREMIDQDQAAPAPTKKKRR